MVFIIEAKHAASKFAGYQVVVLHHLVHGILNQILGRCTIWPCKVCMNQIVTDERWGIITTRISVAFHLGILKGMQRSVLRESCEEVSRRGSSVGNKVGDNIQYIRVEICQLDKMS